MKNKNLNFRFVLLTRTVIFMLKVSLECGIYLFLRILELVLQFLHIAVFLFSSQKAYPPAPLPAPLPFEWCPQSLTLPSTLSATLTALQLCLTTSLLDLCQSKAILGTANQTTQSILWVSSSVVQQVLFQMLTSLILLDTHQAFNLMMLASKLSQQVLQNKPSIFIHLPHSEIQ